MSKDNKEALIKDLDIQWRDHFHMRDQTWKTLTSSLVLFLGMVGLELKGLGAGVMVPAYTVVLITAVFGISIAAHHRHRQGQKFEIISLCEKELDIADYKKEIVGPEHAKSKDLFTARFIELVHLGIGLVAVALLINSATA